MIPAPARDLVGLSDVKAAACRISGLVVRTPVVPVQHPTGPRRVLWCKAESLQPTGAFKLRGAASAILAQHDAARNFGVVAQSSGNHARAVAWLCDRLALQAVIVMPDTTPQVKVDAVRRLGPRIEFVSPRERDTRPIELAAEHGYIHVPPYDDPLVIAGQGTIGRELAEEVDGLDVVLVPVSGGGLIAGVAAAVKSLHPGVRVVGVEPDQAADAAESVHVGRRVEWPAEATYRTIADGLRTTVVGEHAWPHIRQYVDDIVTVTDQQILSAMGHLAVAGRLVSEPAGATAAAAWLADIAGVAIDGAKVAAVVSGGSVDPDLLTRALAARPECS